MSYKKTLTCFSFTCSSQSEDVINRCRHSNKILLPPNVLHDLITQDLFKEDTAAFSAETHWRIAFPIACLVMTLIAVPLSYVPVRKDMKYTLILAFIIVLFYYNSIVLGKHWLSNHLLPISLGIWWIQCLFVAEVGLFTLFRMQIVQRLYRYWKSQYEA